MGLSLVVQRRAPEPENALVAKRCAVEPLGLLIWRARRAEVRIARVERRTILEYEARVMSRRHLRVAEGSRTELPVRIGHREVTARLEAAAALEKQDAHPRLGEGHRREAAAGP